MKFYEESVANVVGATLTGGFFLTRDAMLARYMLSSTVSPSVCPSVRQSVRHKPVLCGNDWTNRAGFWHGASFHLSHTVL